MYLKQLKPKHLYIVVDGDTLIPAVFTNVVLDYDHEEHHWWLPYFDVENETQGKVEFFQCHFGLMSEMYSDNVIVVPHEWEVARLDRIKTAEAELKKIERLGYYVRG